MSGLSTHLFRPVGEPLSIDQLLWIIDGTGVAPSFLADRSNCVSALVIKPEGRWSTGKGSGKSEDLAARWSDSDHPRIDSGMLESREILCPHAVLGIHGDKPGSCKRDEQPARRAGVAVGPQEPDGRELAWIL